MSGVPCPKMIVVSGGMGASGEQVARTALAQFEGTEVPIEIAGGVRTVDEVREIVDRAAWYNAVILHTLVDDSVREALVKAAQLGGVAEIDLMGPTLDILTGLLGRRPACRPGLYRKVRESYFRRIEAIEFAVRHDDGGHYEELSTADIVLTGVSRAGKTPLSMYLAMRGFRTANVPLVVGLDPPEELFAVQRGRVVGLTLDSDLLVGLRRRRQQGLGKSAAPVYADPREVFQDLENAREVFRRGRFATIDVTLKPIEESANEVVGHVTRQCGSVARVTDEDAGI